MKPGCTLPPVPRGLEVRQFVRVSSTNLAQYRRVCGLTGADDGGTLPIAYLHVLGEALALGVLLPHPKAILPLLPPPVHYRQRITMWQRIPADALIELVAYPTALKHADKGVEVELVCDAYVVEKEATTTTAGSAAAAASADNTVNKALAYRGTLTGLYRYPRGSRSRSSKGSGSQKTRKRQHALSDTDTVIATEDLASDAGRQYAAASGDYNPIHTSAFMGRAFGFPGAIVHGMWELAWAMGRLEASGRCTSCPVTVDMEFKRPVVLPSSVSLAVQSSGSDSDETVRFKVVSKDGEQLHATGWVVPNASESE